MVSTSDDFRTPHPLGTVALFKGPGQSKPPKDGGHQDDMIPVDLGESGRCEDELRQLSSTRSRDFSD